MIFDRKNLDDNALVSFYKKLLFPRVIEEKVLTLLRQGKIAQWFPGIGQEAIAVGSTMAMEPDEYILSGYRNLGVFTARDIPFTHLIAQWQGKASGFTNGRDSIFHFSSPEHKIIGMTSHQGSQLSLATGIALADVLSNRKKATLVFTGEGSTSEGDFHEALNIAAVWNLPIIFLVENNGYSLSTPVSEQYKCRRLADKAIGYGIEGRRIDGNNILEVYKTVTEIATAIRQNPRPVLLECMTFRMHGHEDAGENKYIPDALLSEWQDKDPIANFGNFLLEEEVLRREWIPFLKNEFAAQIDAEIEKGSKETDIDPDINTELDDVYKPHATPKFTISSSAAVIRYIDAIKDALKLSMRKHSNLILMGQDIAEYGGVFKATKGLAGEFGKERVRNTPACESGIIGTAMGLTLNGYKAVVEMQLSDFISNGFNQVVNNLAKSYYRRGQSVNVVIRMPAGTGQFQSQSNEAWFTKTPGLKVVYPAFPADAKGLLMSAIEDPNPVIYFEHKHLYRNLTGEVPDGNLFIEIGKARVVKKGTRASIITYGMGVHWALEYLNKHPEQSIEIVDLRSLQPWDKATVEKSVKKTTRVLILHEDTLTSGFGAEIAAHIAEHCFSFLEAPVMRCASLDTPIPMNKELEEQFLAKSRLEETMEKLLKY
jgi:2-oxoisovalerate dehydrogenase E1 component